MADYPYEEGSKGNNAEEGLEITKLGISQEIVSALAKKGITKLFPIQVKAWGGSWCFSFFVFDGNYDMGMMKKIVYSLEI